MTGASPARIGLSGTNLERAADHNQRVTLHAIRVTGSLTRVDLAHITGLTPATIANITKRLLAEGLIEEAGRLRGGRGQPPTKLVINPNARYSIGVNIDRDHVTMVVVNFVGQTVARVSREVEFALPGEIRTFYQRSVDKLIKRAKVDVGQLVGVGIARPDDLGLVDLPGRPAAYAEWEKADVARLFAEPLNLPVFVENDAAAAAMGELQLGLGQGFSSFFYILISSGLGGGLVIDGAYFRGADRRSGELGFLMSDDGRGARSQIQNFVSLSGLARPLEAAGLTIVDMLEAGGRDERIEPIVDAWIDDAVERLAEPLTAINCLINPAAVLIGGRLPGEYVDRLADRLSALLGERALNAPVLAPIKRAMLAEDAPAVGAAILPLSHFLLPKPNALWKAQGRIAESRSLS
ncbi:ROK family transcriptional regulator [Sphingomonas gilva]|uniref:ROK family transcriptional regulator n=1 Tax=Sphingomonas gilva TaxID=2305907 RepID=A0A396RS02_9SPHN|nr:ROK family transcriptional regulator [Sphingomonas gilva]RHW19300.1 ROK family transcriptional regulator [Sphingomonas gilva]